MDSEEILDELLLQWEEAVSKGENPQAHELCKDYPGLIPEVQKRIEGLRALSWLDEFSDNIVADDPNSFIKEFNDEVLWKEAASPLPGYSLAKRLRRGGFGEIWKAIGPGDIPVALKIIPCNEKIESGESRAIQAIKDIRHPHLISIFGAWHSDAWLVIGMELAEGNLLDRLMLARQNGQQGIEKPQLLNWIGQAAQAVDFLHEQGLHHRDIKPQNLLLLSNQVKVGDFGLIRVMHEGINQHSGTLTVSYAAPEYFRGEAFPQSDQYSLAITWYQLRTGKLPFQGNPEEVITGHLNGDPDLTDIPELEQKIVAKALAKKPEERWESCQSFVGALRESEHSDGTSTSKNNYLLRYLLFACTIPGFVLTYFLLLGLTPISRNKDGAVSAEKSQDNADNVANELTFYPGFDLFKNVRSVVVGKFESEPTLAKAFLIGAVRPCLINLETGEKLRTFLPEGGPGVALAPFAKPKGVSVHDNGEMYLWNLETGEKLQTFRGHKGSVSAAVFSPNGKKLVSASIDNTVRVWDVKSGKEEVCLKGHTKFVMSIDIDSTGKYALSGSWDGQLIYWDLVNQKIIKRLQGHTGQVWCGRFSESGFWAISGSSDMTARIWDLQSGKEVWKTPGQSQVRINAVGFVNPSTFFTTGDNRITLWDMKSKNPVLASPGTGKRGMIQCAQFCFLKDGPAIVFGTDVGGLGVWRVPIHVLDRHLLK